MKCLLQRFNARSGRFGKRFCFAAPFEQLAHCDIHTVAILLVAYLHIKRHNGNAALTVQICSVNLVQKVRRAVTANFDHKITPKNKEI